MELTTWHDITIPGNAQRENYLLLLAVASLLLFIKLCVYLQGYEYLAVTIVIALRIVHKALPFVIVLFFCLVFFTGAFQMLVADSYMTNGSNCDMDDSLCEDDDTIRDFRAPPWNSFTQVFTMGESHMRVALFRSIRHPNLFNLLYMSRNSRRGVVVKLREHFQ